MLSLRHGGVTRFMKYGSTTALVFLVSVGCRNRTQSSSQAAPSDEASARAGNVDVHVAKGAGSPPSYRASPVPIDSGSDVQKATVQNATCPAEMAYLKGGKLTRYAVSEPIEIPALCIDRFEVTAGEYGSCMAKGHCQKLKLPSGPGCNLRKDGREKHPMNCIPWAAAKQYCESVRARLPSFTYLLWAIHNGSSDTKWPWGDDVPTESFACWKRIQLGVDLGTCEVGSHPRDRTYQGINDLAGSVAEWTLEEGRRRFDRLVVSGDYLSGNAEFVVGLVEDSEADSQTTSSVGFRCVRQVQ